MRRKIDDSGTTVKELVPRPVFLWFKPEFISELVDWEVNGVFVEFPALCEDINRMYVSIYKDAVGA